MDGEVKLPGAGNLLLLLSVLFLALAPVTALAHAAVVLQPQPSFGGTSVEAMVNGRRLEVSACGSACRSAEADLRGGERVVVRVPVPHGGLAVFDLPGLPAEDGTALIKVADARMHQLTTYRVHEVLRPALRPLSADYDFQVPDRMHLTVNNGFERISIGSNFYTRDRPGSAWQLSGGLEPINPRRFLWEYQPVTAPFIVGSTQMDSTQTQVISFFEGGGPSPIWFRIWVDVNGLVLRAEMRARGHFMDHLYHAFDEPLSVDPPTPP